MCSGMYHWGLHLASNGTVFLDIDSNHSNRVHLRISGRESGPLASRWIAKDSSHSHLLNGHTSNITENKVSAARWAYDARRRLTDRDLANSRAEPLDGGIRPATVGRRGRSRVRASAWRSNRSTRNSSKSFAAGASMYLPGRRPRRGAIRKRAYWPRISVPANRLEIVDHWLPLLYGLGAWHMIESASNELIR